MHWCVGVKVVPVTSWTQYSTNSMWKTLNPKYYQHLSWFFCIKFIPVLWNMKHWRAQSQLQASLVDVTIISHLSPAPLFPAVGPKISIIFINHRSHPAMIGLLMHMQKGWALKLKCGLYWHVRSESHFDVCVFCQCGIPFVQHVCPVITKAVFPWFLSAAICSFIILSALISGWLIVLGN